MARFNSRHSDRLSVISSAPGTFVYDGKGESIDYTPTPLKTGSKDPVLDEAGAPVIGADGNQVFEKPGRIIRNIDGTPKLGGHPKETRIVLTSRKVFGVEFPAGKPVFVGLAKLAQKLRCLHGFEEVEGGAVVEDEPKAKRGRPAKAKNEEPND